MASSHSSGPPDAPAGDPEWLLDFTRRLVEDHLAACGQDTLSFRSIYRRQGAVEDDPEARVALHTRAGLVPAIVERTSNEHSYDRPCVIALPVFAGNPAHIDWILAGTSQPANAPTAEDSADRTRQGGPNLITDTP